jgi:hypothetical protein
MIQTKKPQIHATMVGADMAGEGMDGKCSVLRGIMILNVQEVSKGTIE